MVLFDNIEDIFDDLRNYNEYSKALVTFATAAGAILILFITLKFIFLVYKEMRLYLCCQLCCKTDLRKKYGQWALVTGATDGIGLSIARELARKGMSILVVGRNEEKLLRTKLSLSKEPNVGEVVTVKIDLSDSSIENYEQIRSQIDPENRDIGILVNNAGVFMPYIARLCNFKMEDLRDTVNVNILGTVYMTRMILPGMVERGKGLVLNVSSILGSIPSPYMGVYGQTKSFMDSFSQNLQMEYASHPIDIINLTPGPVRTKLLLNTSNISSNPAIPTPDEYAKSSINAISARYESFCGVYIHEHIHRSTKFLSYLGLMNMLMKISISMNGRDVKLSPVMKRRPVPQAQEAT